VRGRRSGSDIVESWYPFEGSPSMENEEQVRDAAPIRNEKSCRHCAAPLLSPEAVICSVCRSHQREGLLGRVLHWAPLAPVASAFVSFCLLALSFAQLWRTTNALDVANDAKRQAIAASSSLTSMVNRLGSVEGVLTQVDLSSNGRKLCLIYEPATFDDPTLGTMPLYVPAKWTAKACVDQAKLSPAGTKLRLGCVFVDHASVGKVADISGKISPPIPAENCGW
jgi:hypothetical protein